MWAEGAFPGQVRVVFGLSTLVGGSCLRTLPLTQIIELYLGLCFPTQCDVLLALGLGERERAMVPFISLTVLHKGTGVVCRQQGLRLPQSESSRAPAGALSPLLGLSHSVPLRFYHDNNDD